MDTHLAELGAKVAEARLTRGWSKESAAREARISSITWKRVEDGLGVHDVKRAAVLRVLGLDHNGDPVGAGDARVEEVRSWDLSAETEAKIIAILEADAVVTRASDRERPAN